VISPPPATPDRWAVVYDAPTASARDFSFRRSGEVALDACLSLGRPGELWVDVGCGTGHVSRDLARGGLRVVGIDSDPRMIESAHRRFSGRGAGYAPTFARADAMRLPFPDGGVNGIVAVSLTGCLDVAEGFLSEAGRALRPGGLAVLTFTNRRSALLRLNRALRGIGGEEGAAGGYRLYDAEGVARTVAERGFEIRGVRFYNLFLNPRTRVVPAARLAPEWERRCPVALRPRLARNFLVVAART
jgi:SAM-dependent methyltransferase